MVNSVLWRRLDLSGHEICRLECHDKQWELSGTAIFLYEKDPCKLDYLVLCDSNWQTTSAQVKGMIGNREVKLDVTVDNNQRWRLNGEERPVVDGCIDIDLGFSPSTNLLPIRRLSLAIGEEAEVKAA